MKSPARSDALVFFGATGDLAYKTIFPALQAMIQHGRLDVPYYRHGRPGWKLDQLRSRARDSVLKRRETRPGCLRKLLSAPSLRRRRLRRPGHLRPGFAPPSAPRAPDALSGHPARTVPDRHRGAQTHPLRATEPASWWKSRSGATWPRRRRSTARCGRVPGERDLPHRPLSRQGAGAEPDVLPVRQHVSRADLEPQLRRQRADHHGREFRRGGARRVLRRGRARSATCCRTTCCR